MPVFQLTDQILFPHPDLAEPNGLLAIGGDLTPERLIAGYRLGIFPWYSEGDPILWWFTSPRLILIPEELNVSKRLSRYLRNSSITYSVNRAFERVIQSCAQTRILKGDGTWITGEMIEAFSELHRQGYAHSVECWIDDRLVGGLYGIALGKVFFGESMFSSEPNSSKFALIHLTHYLQERQYGLIDCQMTTDLLTSMGAREVGGKTFQTLLKQNIHSITPDKSWTDDTND